VRWLLLSIVVVSTVAGDLLQSFAMKEEARGSDKPPGLARVVWLVMRRRFLLLSILCMAISFFGFLALVQTEPLSFAVPASAASFILETALAKTVLGERISLRRGLGALFVFAGILLISK
jgi:drug/metabolite transporter (DMT)-like permease